MNKHSLSFAFVFLFFLLIVLAFFLWRFSSVEIPFIGQYIDENSSNLVFKNKDNSWTSKIANLQNSDYALPSNLIDIKIEGKSFTNLSKRYQLKIDNCDDYSLFCLRQVMDKFGAKFTIIKENNIDLIYIDTDQKNLISEIVDELKKYDINSNAKEF